VAVDRLIDRETELSILFYLDQREKKRKKERKMCLAARDDEEGGGDWVAVWVAG
jgi:hypothetical protein